MEGGTGPVQGSQPCLDAAYPSQLVGPIDEFQETNQDHSQLLPIASENFPDS